MEKKYLLQSEDGYVYTHEDSYITIPDPSIRIDPSTYSYPFVGGSKLFNVDKTLFVDWNVSSVPNWITYTEDVNGFDTSCNANNTGIARSGNIEIVAPIFSTDSILVPVTQTYVTPSMTVNPASHAFDGNGSSRQFVVTSNVPWDVSTYSNWVSVYSKTGLDGNGYFYASAAANHTGSTRSGSIVLKSTTYPDLYPAGRTVSITQPEGRTLSVTYSGAPVTSVTWAYNDGFCCTYNTYYLYVDVTVSGGGDLSWYAELLGGGNEIGFYPTSYSGSYSSMSFDFRGYEPYYGRVDFYWSDNNAHAYSIYMNAYSPYC